MAINFYSSISLNQNELQNAVVQNAGSDPTSPTPVAGQIYYNSGDNTLRFHNGTSFQTLSTSNGDITGVTAGDGLTGGGASGDVTLDVNVDDSSIEINADALRVKALGITNAMLAGSIENAKLTNSSITLTQGAGMAALGSVSLGGSIIVAVDGVLEDLDTLGAPASDGQMIVATGAGAFQYESGTTLRTSIGVDPAGTDNSTDVTLVTTSHDYLSIVGQAITLGTIENNDLANSSITIDGTSVSLGGSVTTDNDDVSNANLLTALANLESSGGAANENIVIGTDSGDTIVITGNLQVQGTTTTVDSNTVTIGDHNIVLDKDNSTSAVVDGAGITLEGGTGDDITWMWSAGNSRMELKAGASLAVAAFDEVVANVTGDVAGNASTATTATNINALANNSTNETVYLTFVDGATGTQRIETDTALNYNPSTNILTVVELDVSGDVDVDGTLETDALTINGTTILNQATTSDKGAVELATSAETQTGTDTTRAVTPDGLAARMVVADIVVSSLTDSNIVTITHNLGTADIMVQVYDKTTEANIMCDIARTTDDFATASTSVVSIDFGTAPPNDCRALITSLKGATASGTVAYT